MTRREAIVELNQLRSRITSDRDSIKFDPDKTWTPAERAAAHVSYQSEIDALSYAIQQLQGLPVSADAEED